MSLLRQGQRRRLRQCGSSYDRGHLQNIAGYPGRTTYVSPPRNTVKPGRRDGRGRVASCSKGG